jgi:molybdate transport system substrate-binding protein
MVLRNQSGRDVQVLKLASTIGVQGAVGSLLPKFEAASGTKVEVVWATAPMLVKRLQEGEAVDVLILNEAGMKTMTSAGRILEGSQVVMASSPVAIAVKAGAPKPDISTPEAFKKMLLSVKSLSYSDPKAGGASGIYFGKLIEQWGIADAINAKNTFPKPAGYCAEFLLSGQAEIAIQQKPELLHVRGVEIVGTLPGELDMVTTFIAGLAADSTQQAAGRALIDFLRLAESKAAFKAKGLNVP